MSNIDLRSAITLPSQAGCNACLYYNKDNDNIHLYISNYILTSEIINEKYINNKSKLITTKNNKYIIPSYLTIYNINSNFLNKLRSDLIKNKK